MACCGQRRWDYDQDGDLDLIASSLSGPLVLLQNDGAGNFVDASSQLQASRIGQRWMQTTDLDADGFDDAITVWFNGDIDVLWGSATGLVYEASVVTNTGAIAVEPADADADGDLDLVILAGDGSLFRADSLGSRQFSSQRIFEGDASGFGVGDVDADGTADVMFFASSDVRVMYRCSAADPGHRDGCRGRWRVPALSGLQAAAGGG